MENRISMNSLELNNPMFRGFLSLSSAFLEKDKRPDKENKEQFYLKVCAHVKF